MISFVIALYFVASTALPAFSFEATYSDTFSISSAITNDDGIQILHGIGYEDVVSHCDMIISDFNNDDGDWKAKENIKSVVASTAVSVSPYKIFEGSRHLCVYTDKKTNIAHTIDKSFDEPIDISEYNSFFVALNTSCGESDGISCEITLTFITNEERLERTLYINTGEICGVVVDISELNSRNALSGIELSFKSNDIIENENNILLQMDYIAMSRSNNLAAAINFLTEHYVSGGGEITVGADCISFLTNSNVSFIETSVLNHNLPNSSNAICIKLSNYSSADKMTFYYTTEDAPQYKSINSFETELYTDTETHYYYIPIRSLNIMQFRIVFNGDNPGLINIQMIRAVESFSFVQTEYGSLDSVIISENKRDIIIRGTINDEILDIYNKNSISKNAPIALYCLNPGDDYNDIITLATSQIDQTGMKETFRFSIPLETAEYSRINCKFAVGITTNNGITLIDNCKYISNPEILATSVIKPSESSTKKAFCADAITSEVLCADSYIEINLCRLLSSDESNVFVENIDGIYYFNQTYVNQLDEKISSFARSDISLTASLIAIPTDNDMTNNLVLSPDIKERYTSSAFNVSNSKSVAAISATVVFLVNRYCVETPIITDFIVGGNLCDTEYGYWSGRITLSDYVKNYCDAFRIIYTSIKSTCAYPKVNIRMGYSWDNYSAYSDIYNFSARQMLDMIALRFKSEGDISWNIALDVTHEGTELYLSYNDNDTIGNFASPVISVKNADMLCRYMELDANKYNESVRSLIVLDFRTFPVEDQAEADRAEYIYSFIKLNTSECNYIKKYISNRNYLSDKTFDMMKYIDCNTYFEHYSDYALDILSLSGWEALIESDIKPTVLRVITESTFSNVLPDSITGNYTLFDFSDMSGENGWVPSVNCSIISTGNEVLDHSALLTAALNRTENSTYRGIVNRLEHPIDLSSAPYINFDIQMIGASRNAELIKLIITIYSGDNYIEFTDDIESTEWHSIMLDLSGFEKITSVDKIKIWISDGENNIASPTMMLSSFVASSTQYSSNELDTKFAMNKDDRNDKTPVNGHIVWTLVFVAVVTVTVLVLHILSNNRGLEKLMKNKKAG